MWKTIISNGETIVKAADPVIAADLAKLATAFKARAKEEKAAEDKAERGNTDMADKVAEAKAFAAELAAAVKAKTVAEAKAKAEAEADMVDIADRVVRVEAELAEAKSELDRIEIGLVDRVAETELVVLEDWEKEVITPEVSPKKKKVR